MLRCNKTVVAALTASIFGALAAPPARAADEKIVIAIYAPNAPFESGDARYAFASKLAQHISSSTGIAAEGKAFAKTSDFDAAVKKGQVDFAIVDGVFLGQRGVPWPVLASAVTSGDTSQRWWLVASEGAGVLDLQGKRLAQVQSAGRDAAFVDNVLLEGELPKLFGARQSVPDVNSAVAAVALHKADAAFAPESATKGLKRVFDAGRVPNPALVAVKTSLPKETVDKVKAAALSAGGGGLYDGWKGASDGYRSVASRLNPRARKPAMADPSVVGIDPVQALSMPALDPGQPDLRAQFFPPPGRP